MQLHEAILAVECHAVCEYRGAYYFAYGLSYTNRLFDEARLSIVLHDKRAPSTLSASPADVSVKSWRDLTEEKVKQTLERYKKILNLYFEKK